MFCRPSRFIWFSIGSLATFAWMHYRKEGHLNCRRTAQVGYDGGSGHGQWGPLGRNVRFDEQHQQQQQWGSRQGADDPRLDANGGQRAPSPDASGRLPVDREFDRLREMSRNAEETVSSFVCRTEPQKNNNELFLTDQRDVRSYHRQYDGRSAAFERGASLFTPPVYYRDFTVLIMTCVATG
jgi:hypothetical protein